MEVMGHVDEGPVRVAPGKYMNSHIFYKGDGFYYKIREIRNARVRLQCRHYSRGCRATAGLNLDSGMLYSFQRHAHPPDHLLLEDMDLRKRIVTEAKHSLLGQSLKRMLDQIKIR